MQRRCSADAAATSKNAQDAEKKEQNEERSLQFPILWAKSALGAECQQITRLGRGGFEAGAYCDEPVLFFYGTR